MSEEKGNVHQLTQPGSPEEIFAEVLRRNPRAVCVTFMTGEGMPQVLMNGMTMSDLACIKCFFDVSVAKFFSAGISVDEVSRKK